MMTPDIAEHGYSAFTRFFARTLSILFHPLLVGVGMMAYITFIHPTLFLAVSERSRLLKMATFANNNFIFPVLVVLLLKGLGFSSSIYLRTQKERIIPYIASVIFFFWTWNVFNHQEDAPQALRDMCQGIFFAASAGLVLNSYFKISMHAIGMGGLVGLMLMLALQGQAYSLLPLAIALILSGLVCTARLIDSDHRPFDILSGFLMGFLAQWVATGV